MGLDKKCLAVVKVVGGRKGGGYIRLELCRRTVEAGTL